MSTKPWETYNFGVKAEPVLCEHCNTEIDPRHNDEYCTDCYMELYCECGQRLEDSWGSPGDGFCVMCR